MSVNVNATPVGVPLHDEVAVRVVEDMTKGTGAALQPYPTMKVLRRVQREGFIILGNGVGR